MFSHCVAAGAAATLYIEYSLCRCIEGAVRDVPKHGYVCPAVNPSCIIRSAPVDYNLCAEHAHAAEPLADRSVDHYSYSLSLGPDSAAYTVLSVSQDVQIPRTVSDCLLYLLFKNTGWNPFAVDNPVNGYRLERRALTPSLALPPRGGGMGEGGIL